MSEKQLDLFVTQMEKIDSLACEIFEKNQALAKAQEVTGLDLNILQEAFSIVASLMKEKITKYNPGIGIGRWGDFVERVMRHVGLSLGFEYVNKHKQPRLYNQKLNIQFLIMTANSGLGNVNEVLKPTSEKGEMTRECIEKNQKDYLDDSTLRTFIIYIPSLKNEILRNEHGLSIPIEIVYPIGYKTRKGNKVIPHLYACRIIHYIDMVSDFVQEPDLSSSPEITADTLNISLK